MNIKPKKVLIVTYYWPPSAGGGVQRWLKFAKNLPKYGWEPIIYTPKNPDFGLMDESLLADIDSELIVLKEKIWEPYGLFKIFSRSAVSSNAGQVQSDSLTKKMASWLRGNFFIPDPRKYWVKPSIAFLNNYIRDNDINVVVTTGPPHSMHLIGLGLKKSMDIKWLVDIRDPWSQFDLLDKFYIMNSRRSKYEQLEKAVLDTCDGVIATSPSMQNQLVTFDKNKFQSITNGYDSDDFATYFDRSEQSKIIVYHAGLINAYRNPKNLWDALSILVAKDLGLAESLCVQLVGSVESSVTEYIQSYDDSSFNLRLEPYKSHEEVLVDYSEANVLLLLVNNSDNANVNIPGKTFEYLAARKPIICVSRRDTDVWKLLEQYAHVLLVEYDKPVPDLVKDLEDFFQNLEVEAFDPAKYSRESLTRDLVDVLEGL